MTTAAKIRNQILKKIKQIPEEHLTRIDKYLKKLESGNTRKKRILSYAGALKDLDDDVLHQFTNELSARRKKNTRRTNETSAD
ncbi:MAG: hypothetical protein IH597_16885 [Bacteroidales bacterium]|nr:hypothetical protein [Bacteroidales bacterium]